MVATTKMAIHATTLNYTLCSDASITPHQGGTTFTTQDPKQCFFEKNLRSKEQDGGTGRHCYAQGQVGVAGRTPPAAVLPIWPPKGFDGKFFLVPKNPSS